MFFEFGFAGFKVTDEANNDRIVLGKVKHPLIVFEQCACFDDNRARDPKRFDDLLESIRECSLVEHRLGLRRPRNPLRPGWIVKMSVRVNDAIRECG